MHRAAGYVFIAVATVLFAAALTMWADETQRVQDARTAFPPREHAPDRSSAFGLGAISGVLFVSGVIVLVGTPTKTNS